MKINNFFKKHVSQKSGNKIKLFHKLLLAILVGDLIGGRSHWWLISLVGDLPPILLREVLFCVCQTYFLKKFDFVIKKCEKGFSKKGVFHQEDFPPMGFSTKGFFHQFC